MKHPRGYASKKSKTIKTPTSLRTDEPGTNGHKELTKAIGTDPITMAALAMKAKQNVRLPPEVNRILFVKNLPFKITSEDLYEIFGKYGAIRQIRVGDQNDTRGTAFVVYEDIFDAKNACDHLSGFNVGGRYLVVLYYQPSKQTKKIDTEKKKAELEMVKQKYGINDEDEK